MMVVRVVLAVVLAVQGAATKGREGGRDGGLIICSCHILRKYCTKCTEYSLPRYGGTQVHTSALVHAYGMITAAAQGHL